MMVGDVLPVPDPTLLTTQQLLREINGLREVIQTRLDGMDKAIELLQATSDRFPARIDEKILSLARVHEEKFDSIRQQFIERDVRTEQTARDSKVAVDAALQAAKEAVGEQNKSSALSIAKSETATMKQIDQLGVLVQTATRALEDKIGDIKDRLTRIEGKGEGQTVQTHSSQASVHLVLSGLALLVSLAMAILVVVRMTS